MEKNIKVALVGNPNVGKSSLFNKLTGMHQHTGNWTGKTVGVAEGKCQYAGKNLSFIDLPGTYSLDCASDDERVTREYLETEQPDFCVVVCEAGNLERSLLLAFSVKNIIPNTLLCVNLLDEAAKKGLEIDFSRLETLSGMACVGTSARNGKGIDKLLEKLTGSYVEIQKNHVTAPEELARKCADECLIRQERGKRRKTDEILDKIFAGRFFAFPVLALLLALIFYFTVKGADYPSGLLTSAFGKLGELLESFFVWLKAPARLTDLLVNGVYKTTAWVVAVMLPPMAIFFPLFTLFEDFGYLPRAAFVFDRCFSCCGSCGKQALTMCMGLGCNAAGVTGCRIISSPREKLIAILTNSLMPCNGKFPTLIVMLSILSAVAFGGYGTFPAALMLTLLICLSVGVTLIASKILSVTVLRGRSSGFILEMPPYRRPKIVSVLVRSVFDRTLFVLGRAVAVAAPAGLVIWLLANINIGDSSLITYAVNFLQPIGNFFGLDGVILLSLILALPANEIVLPIMLMCYTSASGLVELGSAGELWTLLQSNGWTPVTLLCFTVVMLFHFPCSTTILTVKKESGKWRWALLSCLIPAVIGLSLSLLITLFVRLFVR